jgi:hypothetical protein
MRTDDMRTIGRFVRIFCLCMSRSLGTLRQMVTAPNQNFWTGFRAHSDPPAWLREYMEDLKKSYLTGLEIQEKARVERARITKPYPWEVRAQIKILEKAEAILENAIPHERPARPNHVLLRPLRLNKKMREAREEGYRRGATLSPACFEQRLAKMYTKMEEEWRDHVCSHRRTLARRKISILTLRRERKRLGHSYLRPRRRGHQINYAFDTSVWSLAEKMREKTGKPNWELVAELISKYLPVKTMTANQALKAYKRFINLDIERRSLETILLYLETSLGEEIVGRNLGLGPRMRISGVQRRSIKNETGAVD